MLNGAKTRAADSSVPSPAQHDHKPRRVRGQLGPFDSLLVQVSRRVHIQQRLVLVVAQPVDEFGQQVRYLGLLRLGDDGGAKHGGF